jgi:hypothetical protein
MKAALSHSLTLPFFQYVRFSHFSLSGTLRTTLYPPLLLLRRVPVHENSVLPLPQRLINKELGPLGHVELRCEAEEGAGGHLQVLKVGRPLEDLGVERPARRHQDERVVFAAKAAKPHGCDRVLHL